jgi:lysyl oxidase
MFGRLFPVLTAFAICAIAAAATAGGSGERGTSSAERLPDLDQELPGNLVITGDAARGRWRLGFASAVRNVGRGPLIVSGRRPRPAMPEMTASQLIERRGAPLRVVADVGRLRYVRSADHEHWHLLGFDRYELRRPGETSAVVRDRKTGFCLGDRYRVRGRRLHARPAQPYYTSRCGLEDTTLLELTEGISVGYGDDYKANLEGQSLRLTGLTGGRYLLVHRVNAGRRLRESDYSNNAASLLIRLRWRAGRPAVRVLDSCPNSTRCG